MESTPDIEHQRIFQEYWELDGEYKPILVLPTQADWPAPVTLEKDQDFYYVMTDAPYDRDSRRLVLNVWVHKKGTMAHTFEAQSILFTGLVNSKGEVVRLGASSSGIGPGGQSISNQYLGEKLSSSEADNILELATRIKIWTEKPA